MLRVKNPVLPGFHPDPSLLRVGEDYYIANSTFEWYPGVEIHHSRDLISWDKIPSPLSEKRLLDMEGCAPSCGIWAPCLTWSDGLFWLIFTNVRSWNSGAWKDTPNFLVTATDIRGPWSDPVYLNSSGFDPSLFHDDDGKKWLVNMEWDYRKQGSRQFSGILLQEYDPKERKLIGPITKIYPGTCLGLVEGPHLYKRNGWYYVFAAEGGTWYEHAETVGRSRSLAGPYEFHPHNPLISSYGHEIDIRKAGHASMCDTPDGKTYLAFLCGRTLPGTDKCVLGRETSIVELIWKDDWPYLKPEPGVELFKDGIARNFPASSFEPPSIPSKYAGLTTLPTYTKTIKYEFSGESIHEDFKTLRTERDPKKYSLSSKKGCLRLTGGQSPVSRYGQTLLARRQTDFCFKAETRMHFEPDSIQRLAGLTWRYDESCQYLLAVSHDDEGRGRTLTVIRFINGEFSQTNETILPLNGPVYLGLTVNENTGYFRYSLDGKEWNPLRPTLEAGVLSDEFGGLGFTGAFVGMFCVDTIDYSAVADFDYFQYEV